MAAPLMDGNDNSCCKLFNGLVYKKGSGNSMEDEDTAAVAVAGAGVFAVVHGDVVVVEHDADITLGFRRGDDGSISTNGFGTVDFGGCGR